MKTLKNGDVELCYYSSREPLDRLREQLLHRVGISSEIRDDEEEGGFFLVVAVADTRTHQFLDAKDKLSNWIQGYVVGWDLARGGEYYGIRPEIPPCTGTGQS